MRGQELSIRRSGGMITHPATLSIFLASPFEVRGEAFLSGDDDSENQGAVRLSFFGCQCRGHQHLSF